MKFESGSNKSQGRSEDSDESVTAVVPAVGVEKLWTANDDRGKYTFSIAGTTEALSKVLNIVRESAASSTDPKEISDFLDGKHDQLNFGVYRFYFDSKESKLTALINGGASSPNLNEKYGPALAALLGASAN